MDAFDRGDAQQEKHTLALELTDEEQAKQKWLIRIEEPVVAQVADMLSADAAEAGVSKEEAAKRAWLASIEEPTLDYGDVAAKHIKSLNNVDAFDYSDVEKKNALALDCNAGDVVACETLSKEEAAKRAWLARVEERPAVVGGF